jgi:DNA-binding transcriptional MerR regulator
MSAHDTGRQTAMMKPTELAYWLNIAPATVRLWAGGEFGRYLSPTGAGGEGRPRLFTERDARIMAFINDMKLRARRREEIHITLQLCEANNWEDLPEMPPAPVGVKTDRLYPEEAVKQITIAQQSSSSAQLAGFITRIDELKAELEHERADKEKLMREIADLRQQMGAIEAELRLWQSGRLKPE